MVLDKQGVHPVGWCVSGHPWGFRVGSPSRSGVFSQAVSADVEKFTESISFDQRLYAHDLRASLAHARMLAEVGLITAAERDQIAAALQAIGQEIAAGQFPWETRLEDIHMHIEQALIDRLGDVGRKLHTGRSRNDQVATDLHLWVRDAIDAIDAALRRVQQAFLERCARDNGVVVPAYTHLRRAQPVLANHYWLAYCEKFQRDRERLADCRKRVNRSPLGGAAVAGTSLPIDRAMVANELGFAELMMNSVDISSDRDFVLEFVATLSLIAIHLSTWAEEWILWSSVEFGFLRLPDAYCTGSSIMPQKINPDVLELIRGRTSRAVGALQGLLVLTKGLPLAYNRDLQEDKLHLFAATDSVTACLALADPLVRETELCREHLARTIATGYLEATTLMEYLIARGVPQRTAHHVVGEIVRHASLDGRGLGDLSLEELRGFSAVIASDVTACLRANEVVRAFRGVGSTSPAEVARQTEAWRKRLAEA